MAVVALLFANQLTSLSRLDEVTWSAQAGSMLVLGLGILATFAATPISLLLAWTALDVLALALALLRQSPQSLRQQAVREFAWRSVGSMSLLAAILINANQSGAASIDAVGPAGVAFALLAVGFRLGVLPIQVAPAQGAQALRGFGNVMKMVPLAGSLVLLVRLAEGRWQSGWSVLALFLVSLAVVFGAINWYAARDAMAGRRFWVLATASLSFISAIAGSPTAAAAWGLALLMGGSVLFFASHQISRMALLVGLALWVITPLPLSPAEPALDVIQQLSPAAGFVFLASAMLLLAGFIKHGLVGTREAASSVLGARVLMIIGLLWMPLTLISIMLRRSAPEDISPLRLGLGLLLILTASALEIGRRRRLGPTSLTSDRPVLTQLLAFPWFYRGLWRTYRMLQFGTGFMSALLEGSGGFLWVLLLLALVLSVFFGGA
jgi:hypothetical protein